VLKGVIDRLYRPIGGQDFSHIADYLINGGYGVADPFMCLADFDSYMYAYNTALKDYEDKADWARKSLMNTATSGVFASDNSIRNYANEIWHATPINKIN
jgi:starch phosphorylase